MAHVLGQNDLLGRYGRQAEPRFQGGLHLKAKVKRIIQLFMNGGASQCNSFDYKPELIRRHGGNSTPARESKRPRAAPGAS